MTPPAKRQVAVVRARDIEHVRVAKALGVAVGRADQGDHPLTRADVVPAQARVNGGDARRVLTRALETEQLFDSRWHQLRSFTQGAQRVRMAQQRQQAGADQVCGGLLRANHGEYEIRDDVVFVEMVAVNVRVRERRDQAATMPHRRLAYRGEEVRTHRVET